TMPPRSAWQLWSYAIAVCLAIAYGFFGGMVWATWGSLLDKSKKQAGRLLLLLGGLVLSFALVLWAFLGLDEALSLSLGTTVGFLIGFILLRVGVRHAYSTILEFLFRPSVFSLLLSA